MEVHESLAIQSGDRRLLILQHPPEPVGGCCSLMGWLYDCARVATIALRELTLTGERLPSYLLRNSTLIVAS